MNGLFGLSTVQKEISTAWRLFQLVFAAMDLLMLNFWTTTPAAKRDDLDHSKLRLRQAVKRDIETQILQGLHVDRILENMQASFRSRDERENIWRYCAL